MFRAPYSKSLFLLAALASNAALVACGSGGGDTNGPTQTVSSVALTAASTDPIVSLGDTRTITAVAKDASGAAISSPSLTWSSSAPSVASVSGNGATGTVVATGNGTATITAAGGSVQGTVQVTVTQRAATVGISGAPSFLTPGATAQISAQARDARARAIAGVTGFTYTSSDQSVAVVNATGLVTAISPGNTNIGSSVTVNGTTVAGNASLSVAFASANAPSAAVTATDGSAFTPSTVSVSVGGAVTWTFQNTLHNVTFGTTAGAPASIGAASSSQVTRTFPTAGTFDYDCTLHAGMRGTVVVQNSTGAPAYTAILNGANERPAAVTTTGAGAASFTVSGGTVAYTVTFSRLTGVPVMSHIHAPGNATQAVGVLVDFPTTGQTLNNGVLTGTFNASAIRNAAISLDSLFKLMGNGNAYVNVHTTQFPGGEIRGQIGVP